jgi:sulfite reductase (NADPH) hemoprotein beta-component
MYVYDELDQALIDQRVAEFRDQVQRRLAGDLTEDEFKVLRLMNGVYLQLHAYMLRVAIPYGTLSARQLRALAAVSRTYDKGYGHFTTRQNLQYNWIRLSDMPDVLADLAKVGLHAIQTSGNCIRNVTTDPFAGAGREESADPRLWAEILRQWSSLHPEFTFLPRKFKIAITAAANDRAAVRVHDVGLILRRTDTGQTGFEVIVGGGLGRSPHVGVTIREFLPAEELIRYLEAILRVYNAAGRRDNIYKARIKILVAETGAEKFRELVEAEYAALAQDRRLDLTPEMVADVESRFRTPNFPPATDAPPGLTAELADNAAFRRWHRNSIVPHRQPGYAIVQISLKPPGLAPGDATADQMDLVADLAERYGFGEIRVAHEQNLVLPHVAQADLPAVWRALKAAGLATPNVGLISDIIACPGLDYCDLANARSIPVAQAIATRFADDATAEDIGRLHINISGCINACAHHHVGHIGVLGVDKSGQEFYQIMLGGRADENARLGSIIGPAVTADQVPEVIARLVETYRSARLSPDESFIDAVDRLGSGYFKEQTYAAA